MHTNSMCILKDYLYNKFSIKHNKKIKKIKDIILNKNTFLILRHCKIEIKFFKIYKFYMLQHNR